MPPRLPRTACLFTQPSSYQTILTAFCPSLSLLATSQFRRTYAMKSRQQKRAEEKAGKKKKAAKTSFDVYDLKDADQFTLVEAVRYIKAFEVGQNPVSVKYDLAVKLRTVKNGPTVKNRIRLPRPVKTDLRICVFAQGKAAEDARKAGAALVGTEELWEQIKNGTAPEFDRCICHIDVFPAFAKTRLGRILGPKGLMPSQKAGTVVPNITKAVKDMVGASEYRERLGVVRMAVGQLGFTVGELSKNIKAFIDSVKFDINRIDKIEKSIHEVVLSSTNSPGFSLTGEVKATRKVANAAVEDEAESMTADDAVEDIVPIQSIQVPIIQEADTRAPMTA